MKRTLLFFVGILLALILSLNTFSQTPQYYNPSVAPIGNSLPFGAALAASGYQCQWLIGPGEYSLPTPAPAGDITKLYIFMSTSGTGTYTNLTIKMGQTALTSLPVGSYSGILDTVYFRASVPLTGVMNAWMSITLDSSFSYNPAQSLVITISHCGISGAGMNIWQNTGTAGVFRRNPMGGTPSCVFTYAAQDTRVLQNGLDISPPVGISNNQIPLEYKLEQNYPNPFNPVTTISFDIAKTGNVKLTVYDMLGREITTLVNELMSAGSYKADFDASNLTSGAYFYKIETAGFVDTKKMMLIK